jgi:hypothetical protein
MPIQVRVTNKIFTAPGPRVLLDAELATLYGATTANLNKTVQRNANRFPQDFMFQLTKKKCGSCYCNLECQKLPATVVDALFPTPSPSKALPCSRACYAVLAPCK